MNINNFLSAMYNVTTFFTDGRIRPRSIFKHYRCKPVSSKSIREQISLLALQKLDCRNMGLCIEIHFLFIFLVTSYIENRMPMFAFPQGTANACICSFFNCCINFARPELFV